MLYKNESFFLVNSIKKFYGRVVQPKQLHISSSGKNQSRANMGRVIGYDGPRGTFIEWNEADPEVKESRKRVISRCSVRIISMWYERSSGLRQYFPDEARRCTQSYYYALAYLYYDHMGIETDMYVPETSCPNY